MLKKILELEEEKNLILKEKIEEKINHKGEKLQKIKGKIIQENKKCDYCKNKKIVKNGKYKSEILYGKINNKKIILELEKQKYKCKKCRKNFIPKVNFLEKNKRISKKVIVNISLEMTQTISQKQIAKQNYVSVSTVARNLQKLKEYTKINKQNLPKIINVDEFTGVKNYTSKMNFIIIDGEKHKIKDILITRQKYTLEKYFLSYTKKAKQNVKYFVCDMYDTYINISKKQLPNAKIIIDRFHTKRLIVNAIRNKRIKIMNTYPKYTYQYRVIKKFRNLLLKKYEKININYQKIKYYEMFNSEYDILMYILKQDKQLEEMYWIYQEFIKAFDEKEIEKTKKIIQKDYTKTNITEEMKGVIKTYKKYEEYIINSLKYPYSNGVVEGINTKIKLIKRVGYGYRNFQNFRIRILLIFNLINIEEDEQRKEKRKKEYHKKSS